MSVIRLSITVNKNDSQSLYGTIVYVVYDQGSIQNKFRESIFELLNNFWLGFAFYYFIALTLLGLLTFRWSTNRRIKNYKKEDVAIIRDQIMTINSSLKYDSRSRDKFDNFIEKWKKIYYEHETVRLSSFDKALYEVLKLCLRLADSYWLPRLEFNIRDYMHPSDSIFIDNLYIHLLKRSAYISELGTNDLLLMKLNEDCLKLAEDALQKINWDKHK